MYKKPELKVRQRMRGDDEPKFIDINVRSSHSNDASIQNRIKAKSEIFEHVRTIYPDALSSDHRALGHFELDVFVPSLSKGIEYDGTYWNSSSHSKRSQKFRARRKDSICMRNDVRLLRITEIEYTQDKLATFLKIDEFLK